MDLLDIKENNLYFDEPMPEEAEKLINAAAAQYGDKNVEPLLLRAYALAPGHLTILVGLYRYYYYQHRLQDAMEVAHKTLEVSGARLEFPSDYRELTTLHMGAGALKSMGMVRFYLLALKAAGYLNLRLGMWDESLSMLGKVIELDQMDRLGASALMDIAKQYASKAGNDKEALSC
jgi:tetratricopeptide (TPR) repeat protein